MEKLTTVQLKALEFIQNTIQTTGITPTLRELCKYMKYASIGSAQDVISALRRKGYLEETSKQKARALIPTPSAQEIFVDEEDSDPLTLALPCLGAVPAGNPLEAVEERVGTLRISKSLINKPVPPRNKLFALRAKGESMIHAGIFDGDWLIVANQTTAPSKSIVVARLENGEATVKRLMKDTAKGWYLKPENPAFKPTFARDRSFEVVGRVVALQRAL